VAVPAGASSWVLRLIFGPLGKLANLRRWLLDIVPAAPQVLQPLDAAIYEPDETKREAILRPYEGRRQIGDLCCGDPAKTAQMVGELTSEIGCHAAPPAANS
jgi:hypothetical protein